MVLVEGGVESLTTTSSAALAVQTRPMKNTLANRVKKKKINDGMYGFGYFSEYAVQVRKVAGTSWSSVETTRD
jgi:hypothetical protein